MTMNGFIALKVAIAFSFRIRPVNVGAMPRCMDRRRLLVSGNGNSVLENTDPAGRDGSRHVDATATNIIVQLSF
jgi:hypothetical protein